MPPHKLKFSWLREGFAICRLAADAPLPQWGLRGSFFSMTRTADELSIVCPEENIPAGADAERGWACLRLEGRIPLSQVGILATLLQPLAERAIPAFVISTFDTDYILVKESLTQPALDALQGAGLELVSHS